MPPCCLGLLMQIQAPGRGERSLSDHGELSTNPRLGIVGERDLAPHHMQNGWRAPAETVAEVQLERPVVAERRACFGLDGGTGLGLAMDARGEAIGALPFERA